MEIALTNDPLAFGFITQEAGEYQYGYEDGRRPLTLDSRPFAKWVLGLDYTFGRHMLPHGGFTEPLMNLAQVTLFKRAMSFVMVA